MLAGFGFGEGAGKAPVSEVAIPQERSQEPAPVKVADGPAFSLLDTLHQVDRTPAVEDPLRPFQG